MATINEHYGKWRVRWTDEHKRRRSCVFATRKEASEHGRLKEADVVRIERGLERGVQEGRTFADLAAYWIKERLPRKRSADTDLSCIKKHFLPEFGTMALAHIGVAEIDRYRATRGSLALKSMANHLTLLKSMLRAAVELQWLVRVPTIKVPRVPLTDKDFRFIQTREGVHAFVAAAKYEGALAYALYATAIYTGMRLGELAGLAWVDIDFTARLVTIRRSFDGPTKNGHVRHVPLLEPLLPILRQWRIQTPGEYVFPNGRGNMHDGQARIFQETLRRVQKAAGFAEIDRRGKKCSAITFHSLRHTFASHWVMNGGDLYKLQKILGHQTVQMTMRYAHLVPSAFVEDRDRLNALALPPSATVHAISQTRAADGA